MTTITIYPIYLTDNQAFNLMQKHLRHVFNSKIKFLPQHASFAYHAEVLENGDVRIAVTYTADSTMISSCGTVFEEVIRPFDDNQLEDIKQLQMYSLAEAAFEQEVAQKRHDTIMAIRDIMFNDR